MNKQKNYNSYDLKIQKVKKGNETGSYLFHIPEI